MSERVARGGHFVPDDTVRRRYARGWANFRDLYQPLADSWVVCDNSGSALIPIAVGSHEEAARILDAKGYEEFQGRPALTNPPLPARLDDFFTPYALECMQRAVAEAVAEHHQLGNPVYVWGDGRVVRLFPDDSTEPVEPTAA